MTIESALAQPGARVAAWDMNSDDHGMLRVYAVGPDGAKLLAEQEVAADAREDVVEDARAKGARIGATHSWVRLVWAFDERGAAIWSNDRLVTDRVPTEGVARVVTFFDESDWGHRGVKCELVGGDEVTVVEEHDPCAALDPTYGRDKLSIDLEWAFYLGRDLAMWLAVPHYDEETGWITNDDLLKVAGAARALAEQVERSPETGPFEHVHRAIGSIRKTGDLGLRFAPSPLEPHRRCIEVRVTSKSGKTTSGRWVKQGSNAQIAAFLRDIRAPRTIVWTMNALLRAQERDGYA